MFIQKLLPLHLLIIAVAPTLRAEITAPEVKSALAANLTHPYLHFTERDKPALLERIKTVPECRTIMEGMLAEANRLLSTPVEPQAPVEEKNTRYFSSGDYDRYYYSCRGAAHTLGFVYQMTGDRRYAQKGFEFADAVCDLPTWVIRAHEFPIIYSRVWPWNCKDDQVVFSVDHVTGDTARLMAEAYDWLYPGLDQRQRDRIRGALLEKAVTRVRGNYDYQWWAAAYRCNWCGVINSGLGLAALALLKEDPQLVDVVAESYNRIAKLFDHIDPDGGWQEGAGYWYYGVHTSVFFADALQRATGGKYNLFAHPRLKADPVNFPLYCLIPPRRTLDFEDSGGGVIGATFFYNKLADETGSRAAAWYRDHLFGDGRNLFDILWPRSQVAPELPQQASIHFRGIDWLVMRSDFTDAAKVTVAAKAGLNDDPHHGHLDVGHFALYWNGRAYVADSGRPEYDEKVFDEARYDYPQASSVGHNVIFVNGEQQIIAKLKDQPWKEGVGGKVLAFHTTPERDYALMDATGAYPGHDLKGWRRQITLEKPLVTVVLDEVRSAPGAEIEARFHSEVTQRARNGYVLLGDEMALITVADVPVAFRPGQHAILPVQKNAQLRWLPYVGAVVRAPAARTVLATVILPVKNEPDAEQIARSVKSSIDAAGNYSLTFQRGDKQYEYHYKHEADGLVLENP